MPSKQLSLRRTVWIPPLILAIAMGCVAIPTPAPSPTPLPPPETRAGAAPTPVPPTATPAPTSRPTAVPPATTDAPPSPAASPTPQPTPPGEALVPQGQITPPPEGFAPTPPPPPEMGVDESDSWVRDYVALVTAMLNSGRGVDEVLNTLTEWSSLADDSMGNPSAVVWAEPADIDADGADEWVMSVPVPGRGCGVTSCPSYLILFEVKDDLFVPGHVVRGSPPYEIQFQNAELRQINDINADGQTEVLLQQLWCGAHTCFIGLTVGRWDGARWHDLADGPISQAYTELTVEDSDDDGALEFSFFGGTFGSVGAGLQRPHRLLFDWRDDAYRLVEDEPAPSDHPYYLMLDANSALADSDWDRALALARAVVQDPDFSDSMVPIEEVGKERIVSYTAVEAMLVHAQRGDVEAMEAVLAQARAHDFVVPNIYTEAAQRLIGVYEETGDVVAACAAMEDVVAERPDEAVFFEWYGYNTARITVDQICPLDEPQDGESPDL